MRSSQFSNLVANIYILGSFIAPRSIASLACLILGSFWLMSACFDYLLEFREARKFKTVCDLMIEEYKQNGNNTKKRR